MLETSPDEVLVDPAPGLRAKRPIDRMLAFPAKAANRSHAPGALVPGTGAA